MARIRTIKPQFWGSKDVVPLSIPARYLAIGLISFADDDGRFIATPKAIGGYVFPHDEKVTDPQIIKWLKEIAATKMVVLYEIEGCKYGYFPKYRTHQKISHSVDSILPNPPDDRLF